MDERVEKFYNLVYGDISPMEEEKTGATNRMFILEHVDAIEAYYNDCMRKDSGAQLQGLSEKQIVEDAIKHIKVEKYSELAYGDERSAKEEMFILKHLDEIDSYYNDCMKKDSGAQIEGLSEKQIVENAIKTAKVEMYYTLAYGDEVSSDASKRMFILDHLKELEDNVGFNPLKLEDPDKEAVKDFLASLKNKQITPTQIGEETINAPTEDKTEAGKVELENGRNEEIDFKDD